MRIHICNQFVWPDCAPTARLSEQLAVCLRQNGFEVVLIGGTGSYRVGNRDRPSIPIRLLSTYQGRRASLFSSFREYQSVLDAFKRYITDEVRERDIFICTSAPPLSINLIDVIKKKGARGIYWLQDYYPDLARGVCRYPAWIKSQISRYWDAKLGKWDRVVKIAENLDYSRANACVIRNWPVLDFEQPEPFVPKTAYFFGNLGYGHSLPHFIDLCQRLQTEGVSISVVGDGAKFKRLPPWINRVGLVDDDLLIKLHWRAEMHLIAADPEIRGAIFPSKYWNSRKTGRKILFSGFAGKMLRELKEVESLVQLPGPEEWLALLKNL